MLSAPAFNDSSSGLHFAKWRVKLPCVLKSLLNKVPLFWFMSLTPDAETL